MGVLRCGRIGVWDALGVGGLGLVRVELMIHVRIVLRLV